MARVVVSLKIFPSDIDVNLNALKERIEKSMPSYASVYRFEEEPIAFGLVALIAHIVLPEDRAGGLDEIERCIQNLEGVGDIQTILVRRI
ncbi:MAG: elongation factor 1-beta [Candidatus Bathyarchaeota archaeon]|nr:elongation factor 1-beta [Candidatus Bathyarchaeota archaeon]